MDCCFCFLKGNKTLALRAVSRNGQKLEYLSKELKYDKEVVLAACSENGSALQYAAETLQNDKELVLAACSHFGHALQYASPELKNNKDVALVACSQDGDALRYASEELQNDKEVVMKACSKKASVKYGLYGLALQFASKELRNNKKFLLAVCSQNGHALHYASEELKNDREVVLAACTENGYALDAASEALRNDKEIVLVACSEWGRALQHASQELKNDKEVVLVACSEYGYALKHASESLRADKEVVMAAVESEPESLKFALGGLNQDKDCLIMAGLWDKDYIDRNAIIEAGVVHPSQTNQKKKIVLSTRFSLAAKSSAHATKFTLDLKKHPYIKNGDFVVYSPNAFNKGTCDPNWTDESWPCRGTFNSCQKPPHLKTGVPQETKCCWRYSFRYQLEEASKLGGFMIQVVDRDRWDSRTGTMHHMLGGHTRYEHILGDGQRIETEMAKEVGIKIFRYFEPQEDHAGEVNALVSKIDDYIHVWNKLGQRVVRDPIFSKTWHQA